MKQNGTETRLCFEKLSQLARDREPCSISIPFTRGRVISAGQVRFVQNGTELVAQHRVLECWPDGSLRWVRFEFQADLPGNVAASVRVVVDPCSRSESAEGEEETSRHGIHLTKGKEGLRVDTGLLRFVIPATGPFLLRRVFLDGKNLFPKGGLAGTAWRTGCAVGSFAEGRRTIHMEDAGPLVARLRVTPASVSAMLREEFLITAFAGKPFIEVEHQFRLNGDQAETQLEGLALRWIPGRERLRRIAVAEGHYRTKVQTRIPEEGARGVEPLELLLDGPAMLQRQAEHHPHVFFGDFWADWTGENGGVTLTVHHAPQLFPKRLAAGTDGIACELLPESAPPLLLRPGMGKTHRLQLFFHPAGDGLEESTARSLQFQMPDVPTLPVEWYREHGPWDPELFPESLPQRLRKELSEACGALPWATGMLHFGDAVDRGYTAQGRGAGRGIWVNNEYDRAHACFLYHALSGERLALDSALAVCRHWLDVDIAHGHPDPLVCDGHVTHAAGHTEGFQVSASHQWLEGLIDCYRFTGRREALEAASGIGRNILRHVEELANKGVGNYGIRQQGWALRAMVALYEATGEARWKSAADRIVRALLEWEAAEGALLSPYTSHTRVRIPFMIALTVNSLARYRTIEPGGEVDGLIVRTVDDLVKNSLGPGGIFYYKELPSLKAPAPMAVLLEALTHAWRLTRKLDYLKIAARQFAVIAGGGTPCSNNIYNPEKHWDEKEGAVLYGEGDARAFGLSYISTILFAGAATPRRLLDWYEYPFPET